MQTETITNTLEKEEKKERGATPATDASSFSALGGKRDSMLRGHATAV